MIPPFDTALLQRPAEKYRRSSVLERTARKLSLDAAKEKRHTSLSIMRRWFRFKRVQINSPASSP